MSKMKSFLEHTAERVAAEKNCSVEDAQAWVLRVMSEEGRDSYIGKLEYLKTIEQLQPTAADTNASRILQKVIADGWCLETETIDHKQQAAVVRTYGLIDKLGYEVAAIIPLSEGVNDAVWIDKLKGDVTLLLETQEGVRRSERDLGRMGSPDDLNLHSPDDLNLQSSLENNASTGAHESPYNPLLGMCTPSYTTLHPDTTLFGKKGDGVPITYSIRNATKFNLRRYSDAYAVKENRGYNFGVCEPGIDVSGKYADTPNAIEESIKGAGESYALDTLLEDAITVEMLSPLRTLEKVPHRLLTRRIITEGEWNLVCFVINHLVK